MLLHMHMLYMYIILIYMHWFSLLFRSVRLVESAHRLISVGCHDFLLPPATVGQQQATTQPPVQPVQQRTKLNKTCVAGAASAPSSSPATALTPL